ncbi:MAG: hypothetical protein ACM3JJ_08325 [Hyphomicrobiales bacterium]
MKRSLAALLVALVAGIAAAPPAGAVPAPRPGLTPDFSISAYFMGDPAYLRETPLLIRVWGGAQYDSLAIGRAHIVIPPGIATVSGDTVRDVLLSSFVRRPPSDRGWVVKIRPMRTGDYVLRGTLTVDGGREYGTDETGFELPVKVRADSTTFARSPRVTHYELVRDGQRYRYADGVLVPIDSTESFLESDITTKPRILSDARAVAPRGVGVPHDGVPLVAILDAAGRLVDVLTVEPEGSLGFGPEILGPAEDALRKYRFAPAEFAGRAVPDYLVVRVAFSPPAR